MSRIFSEAPTKRMIVTQLRDLPNAGLAELLDATNLGLDDLYRGSRGGWVGLRRDAGLQPQPNNPQDDKSLASAITRLLHVDDPERITFLQTILPTDRPPRWCDATPRRQRLLGMLHAAIDSSLPLSVLVRQAGPAALTCGLAPLRHLNPFTIFGLEFS